jgi:hypothetical protein
MTGPPGESQRGDPPSPVEGELQSAVSQARKLATAAGLPDPQVLNLTTEHSLHAATSGIQSLLRLGHKGGIGAVQTGLG